MTERPARFRAVLVGLTLALGLSGCAGTASSAASSSASANETEKSSAAPTGTTAATGRRIEVRVAGGEVNGDTGRVTVPAGEHVTLVISSDVADEVHVHGYDLEAELAPGQPAELSFDATVPGVFEVELHEGGTQLLSLQVG